MLKKANPESLTADLQNFVAEESKAATRVETKELHSAVKVLGKARDTLDEALLARTNLMTQWRTFLTMSLERFRQYTDHFQEQEKTHQENIVKAKEALLQAKTDYHATEEKATATTISDDEDEMRDSTKDSATMILQGLHNMTESLKQLSDQAEAEHLAEEERKAKRPRSVSKEPASAVPSALLPFGGPGQK